MNRRAAILLGFLLVSPALSNAATKNERPLIIEVLSANTQSIPLNTQDNGVPRDCNIMDFSAYCHHSRTAIVSHTMVVQDNHGKSYTISCTVDSIWSKCISLPVGATLSAQWAKRGITIWYPNAKGGESKQTYTIVSANGNASAKEQSSAASPSTQGSSSANSPNGVSSPAPAAISGSNQEKVKCNFSSTPPGAEITLDGKYVGNTPSTIAVGPGTHMVALALSGFAKWRRDLTVVSGSDVNVSATLQAKH